MICTFCAPGLGADDTPDDDDDATAAPPVASLLLTDEDADDIDVDDEAACTTFAGGIVCWIIFVVPSGFLTRIFRWPKHDEKKILCIFKCFEIIL